MRKIKELIDNKGESFYPLAHAQATYTNDGTSVEEELNNLKNTSFVTSEPTTEEVPDIPEYITRTDLDNAIAEAITNTINTPV